MMRVNVVIPDDRIKMLDDLSKNLGVSRSALISLFCSEGLARYYGIDNYSDMLKNIKNEKKEP